MGFRDITANYYLCRHIPLCESHAQGRSGGRSDFFLGSIFFKFFLNAAARLRAELEVAHKLAAVRAGDSRNFELGNRLGIVVAAPVVGIDIALEVALVGDAAFARLAVCGAGRHCLTGAIIYLRARPAEPAQARRPSQPARQIVRAFE